MTLTGENRSPKEKNQSQCHFVHHKSQADWPGIEPGPPRTSLINTQMFHEPGLVLHQEQPFSVKK